MIEPDPERIDDTPPAPIAAVATNWKARLDKAGRALAPELAGGEPPTFACPYCADTGIFISPRRKPVSGAGDCTAWWCRCEVGMKAEAGWWFAKLYPMDGTGRRHLHTAAKALLEKYQIEHHRHANAMQERIDRLRHRYEQERTRKLDAQESAA